MMPGYQEYQFRNESGNARQETGGLRASQETGTAATNQEEGAVRRRQFFWALGPRVRLKGPVFGLPSKKSGQLGGGCLGNVARTFELYNHLWKSKF